MFSSDHLAGGLAPPQHACVGGALCLSGQLPGPPASLAGWCLLFAVACRPRVTWCLPSCLVLTGLGGWFVFLCAGV